MAGVHNSDSVYSWTGFCSALRKIDTLEGLEFHKGTSPTQFLVNIASLLAQVCVCVLVLRTNEQPWPFTPCICATCRRGEKVERCATWRRVCCRRVAGSETQHLGGGREGGMGQGGERGACCPKSALGSGVPVTCLPPLNT